ncbi:MAG: sulfatase-like hydrolase/transferase [Planctomycetes bacterium]|nr:sulfatase-like hydrolase/transferase [Planctomycetota bacterium]
MNPNILTLWLALCCAAAVATAADAPPRKPNVVILFTDDQGTLDAHCFGSPDLYTPNIDRLAASGVKFTQAYAHTVCCPSRAALMTGRHPQRGGVNSWTQGDLHGPDGINMALEEVTLAEALKGAGYRTALFGKWHLGAHRDFGPEKQGFDEFFGIRDGFIDNFKHDQLHGEGFHDLYEGTQEVWADGRFFPEMIVERSLKFIEQNRRRPFFLYLAFNIPHYPEQALKEHAARYQHLPMPRRSYAAVVTTTDHYVGKVLDKLQALDLRENTIIVFQSDNGHSVEDYQIKTDYHKSGYPKGHNYGANGGGNTGKWIGHKGDFFEGGIRTPAILSYPATLPHGAVRDQAVSIMDWYPTVLELCGVKPPQVKLDGRPLLPVIHSASAPSPHPVLHFQWQDQWAIREGDWKLIGKPQTRLQPEVGPVLQLFNLAGEQPERADHAAQQPELVTRLQRLHDAWAKEVAPTPRAAARARESRSRPGARPAGWITCSLTRG